MGAHHHTKLQNISEETAWMEVPDHLPFFALEMSLTILPRLICN
jgi:hypothetical protein